MRRRTGGWRKKLVAGLLGLAVIGAAVGTALWLQGSGSGAAANSGGNQKPPAVSLIDPELEQSYVTIQLAAVGDIMFHNSQLESARNDSGSYDFKPVFEEVKPIIGGADVAIANFETTTAGKDKYAYSGYPRFNSPDEAVDALQAAGFDVLTTANNHSLDTGKSGIIRTLDTIRNRGIDTVGTYANQTESRVLMKEVKGIRLAFLSYTEHVNGLESMLTADELDAMINVADEQKMKEDIAYAKAQGADLVVASVHWGNEYEREPSSSQEGLARMLADSGVDIILGSHPHVIQRSEWLDANGEAKDKTFVIYSMGNFISNQRAETLDNAYTEDGVIVRFEIRKDMATNETTISKVDYVPTWVYRDKEPGGQAYTYRVLPAEGYKDNKSVSDAFKARMERSYKDTMSQMDVNANAS
ncbi:CapA family protein [Paenibacillus harenae]|uniref:CapA family protein n=1 Tax=Paenibacillus harenae TaxID=306543 RepID=UPI0027907970|nr:CapA family protein [Paenibacillus harenae]MDQ0063357.1 poly-gamma-glutamate synthesis protein (capsule biosynthesis protein) [Paenibacillus harenae]